MNLEFFKSLTRKKTHSPKKNFEEKLKDIGNFTYSEDSFSFKSKTEFIQVHWSEIKAIFGYKIDLMAYDEICLDIFYGEFIIRFTEETVGWYIFLEKLRLQFPNMDEFWDFHIIQPPFATNLTLLYSDENLSLEEAKNKFY